jgi:hypothetical protein
LTSNLKSGIILIVDSVIFNLAWEAIEPLIFAQHDFVKMHSLTENELKKIMVETNAVISVILSEFGVTFDELENEMNKKIGEWKNT